MTALIKEDLWVEYSTFYATYSRLSDGMNIRFEMGSTEDEAEHVIGDEVVTFYLMEIADKDEVENGSVFQDDANGNELPYVEIAFARQAFEECNGEEHEAEAHDTGVDYMKNHLYI